MPRKKIKRFNEIESFPNVFDRKIILEQPECWKNYFTNKSPITLELGCGKGDLSVALARRSPDRNFLGIDRKGDRIWKGAKAALEGQLTNIAFLKARIEDLPDYFDRKIAEEIWITFPDPLPKRRQVKHRLMAPAFLEIYRKLLLPGGRIHLKTDDLDLFDFASEVIRENRYRIYDHRVDLYSDPAVDPVLTICTDFEKRHLKVGKKIRYLCFGFDQGPVAS